MKSNTNKTAENTRLMPGEKKAESRIKLTGDLNGKNNVVLTRPYILDYMGRESSSVTAEILTELMTLNENVTHPLETPVTWESDIRDESVKYRVELSLNENFNDVIVFNGKDDYPSQSVGGENSIYISNLMIGKKYFYRVVGKCENGDEYFSETGKFVTDGTPARWVNWGGAFNSRDLGGWKTTDGKFVRQGLIYRGTRLQETDGTAVADEKIQDYIIGTFGLKTDIDLRGLWNDPLSVTKSLNGKMQLISAPITAYADVFVNPDTKKGLKTVFSIFADASKYPLYIHCHGGADRTGTTAFLLNGLLGVPYEDLIRDYELTSFSVGFVGLRYRKDYAIGFFNALNEFGEKKGVKGLSETIELWLTDYVGVTAEEIAAIKYLLLENDDKK
ncbi:MAG: tyrosine-protein phosphatase [Clostridia bacterium]|nr:tyrosine-protein phosphatase [Clostridia bacterium]